MRDERLSDDRLFDYRPRTFKSQDKNGGRTLTSRAVCHRRERAWSARRCSACRAARRRCTGRGSASTDSAPLPTISKPSSSSPLSPAGALYAPGPGLTSVKQVGGGDWVLEPLGEASRPSIGAHFSACFFKTDDFATSGDQASVQEAQH